MSTSSDSSFEVVSDPDCSDVDDVDSSIASTGALSPEPQISEADSDFGDLEYAEKAENSRRLIASLETLIERLNMMERRRLEEDSDFSLVDLDGIESHGSDPDLDFPLEIFSEGGPGAVTDVQKPADTRNFSARGAAAVPRNRANNKPPMKLILCILFYTIGFLLIGIASKQIGFNRFMRAEPLKDAEKIDVPFVSPGDLKFNEELQNIIHNAERTLKDDVAAIKKNKEKLINIKCLEDIPKELMDQWVPDHSQFKGSEAFFSAKKYSGTRQEEFYTNSVPTLQKLNANQMKLQSHSGSLGTKSKVLLMNGRCDYSSESGRTRVSLKNGDLFVEEKFKVGKEYHRFTRVYYIPAEKLVVM